MALINRDKDVSEQKEVIRFVSNTQLSAGASYLMAMLPYPCTIVGMEGGAIGLSGSPQLLLRLARIASGGATSIALGISNLVLSNLGASGPFGYSGLAATGSTLLLAQYKDILVAEIVGANTAAAQTCLDVIVKRTQDVVSMNGSTI